MKMFCESLREHVMNIVNSKRKTKERNIIINKREEGFI